MAVNIPVRTSVNDDVEERGALPWTRLVAALVATLLVAVSIVQWQSIYAGRKPAVVIGLSCVIGAGVAIGLRGLGRKIIEGLTVAVVALVALLALAFPGDVTSLPFDLVSGWKRLATTGLLVTSSAEFAAPPTVTCGVLSFLGAWTAWSEATRARAILTGIFGLLVALAYTIDVQAPTVWFGAGFAVLAGILLASDSASLPAGIAFSKGKASSAHTRRAVLRAGLSVAAVGLATAAVMAVIGNAGLRAEPFALRTELQRTVITVEESTPLAAVKSGQIVEVGLAVFEISVAGLGVDDSLGYISVASLDRYDGAVFSSATAFTPAGAVLPDNQHAGSPPNGPLVEQTVTILADYPFRSLPRSGEVKETSGADLLWNASTGTLASLDPVDEFTITAQVNDRRLDEDATLGSIPAAVWHATELLDQDDVLIEAIDSFISTSLTAGPVSVAQLLELEAVFQSEEFGYNENAPGGHSLAAIADYVRVEDGPRANHVGFAEQAAAAYVITARRLGVPARVVVGYVLPTPLTSAAPSVVVSEELIHAWAEVWTEQGWARVDPTNKANAVSDTTPRQPVTSTQSGPSETASLDEVSPPILAPELAEDAGAGSKSLWWLGVLLLVPLLTSVVVAKRIRSRRRRARTDPNDRALGAWTELRDRLADLGHTSEGFESTIDLSQRFETIDLRDEAATVLRLAPILDIALYSPGGAESSQADEAWNQVDSVLVGARSSARMHMKVRAAFDPRTLISR